MSIERPTPTQVEQFETEFGVEPLDDVGVEANDVIRKKMNREIMHALGCGCPNCAGTGGKADRAIDWIKAPMPVSQKYKDALKVVAVKQMNVFTRSRKR